MKIIVQTIQHNQYPFEVTEELTILNLKEMIQSELGHRVPLQKLILFGRVMTNETKIGELNVKDGNLMVLMVAKVIPVRKEQDIRLLEESKSQLELDRQQITDLENILQRKIEELVRTERRHKEEQELLENKQKEEIKIAGEAVREATETLENTQNIISKRSSTIEEERKEEFKKTEIYGKFEDDCICPITHELMTDPVMAADGFSYEREAITSWFRQYDTSPCTNMVLDHKFLTPNIQLKNIIQTIRKI